MLNDSLLLIVPWDARGREEIERLNGLRWRAAQDEPDQIEGEMVLGEP